MCVCVCVCVCVLQCIWTKGERRRQGVILRHWATRHAILESPSCSEFRHLIYQALTFSEWMAARSSPLCSCPSLSCKWGRCVFVFVCGCLCVCVCVCVWWNKFRRLMHLSLCVSVCHFVSLCVSLYTHSLDPVYIHYCARLCVRFVCVCVCDTCVIRVW